MSASAWAGFADRVAFTGDFLRFVAVDRRFSSWQTRNINWLREIITGGPAWRRPGPHISTVMPDAWAGAPEARVRGATARDTASAQLLTLHGTDFIDAAYQAPLGRAPDADGGSHFLSHVLGANDKVAVRFELAITPEGSARKQPVPGLADLLDGRRDSHHRWRRWLQKPTRILQGSKRLQAMQGRPEARWWNSAKQLVSAKNAGAG